MAGGEWVSASAGYVVPRGPGEGDAWAQEARERGRKGSQRIVFAGEVGAPVEVAGRLGVAVGGLVVVRRRVILLDEEPVELTDTYYPVGIARGTRLAGTRKIPGGAVTLLAEMGHRPLRVGEEVYARMPEAEERRALVLGEGEPVLCLTRVTGGEEGPFQVDVSVFPAARQRLYYDMRTS